MGIAQQSVADALTAPNAADDVAAGTATWRDRAEVVLDQLSGWPCIRPDGGWSLLVDTTSLDMTPPNWDGACSSAAGWPPPR